MLYIAYGSNLSEKRMHERCPNAKFVTKGFLEHVTLGFHYYANLVPAHDYITPVVIWDIPDSEVDILDRAEGFISNPQHYYKEQFTVVLLESDFTSAVRLNNWSISREEHQAKLIEMVGEENVHIASGWGRDEQDGIIGTAYVMTDWKKTEWEKHSHQTPIEYVEHILTGYKEQGFTGQYLQDLWYALYRGENPPESRS